MDTAIPTHLSLELAKIGVVPSHNFSEDDEAPDLSYHNHPYDEDGNDIRLDEQGEPLF